MKKDLIIFLSNGYGEDMISLAIIRELRKRCSNLEIAAMPLVGEGKIYQKDDIRLLGPRMLLPSGGLLPSDYGMIWKDLRFGLARLTLEQIVAVRRERRRLATLVAVGDSFPVVVGALSGAIPMVLVGTAKSDYFCAYSRLECWLFRRNCRKVFARDEATATSLRKCGVNAEWVGNVMMDALDFTGCDFGIPKDTLCFGILPGSREPAYADLPILLEAIERIDKRLPGKKAYLLALSDSLELPRIRQCAEETGWSMADGGQGDLPMLEKEVKRILLVSQRFGDVLLRSRLLLGLAGTGNEQAAGLGKPVVSFSRSRKLGWYRERQKGLLGEALCVTSANPEAIASEIIAILKDDARYNRMAQEGLSRMGPPGAAARIASYLEDMVRHKTGCEQKPGD